MTDSVATETLSLEDDLQNHLSELDKNLDVGKSTTYGFEVNVTRLTENETQLGYHLEVRDDNKPIRGPKELWAILSVLDAGIQQAKKNLIESPGKGKAN